MTSRALLAAGLLTLVSCGGARPVPAAEPVLTLGAVPLGDSTARQAELSALAKHLEVALGGPVRVVVSPNYRDFSQAVSKKEFDLVLLGPVLYSRAHESGYDAVVVALREGAAVRRGVVVARADKGVAGVAQLKGKKVAFVDPHSAAGFQFAFALLYAQGLKPADYQREFLGSHEAVIQAVLEGRFDAGATYDGAVADLVPAARAHELTVIGQTDPIPGEVFAVRADSRLLPKVREELLRLEKSPDAAQVLKPLHADRLVAPAEGLFDGARAIDLVVTEAAGL